MDYIKEIKRLKKEKNALLLAHFYQIPEIQDLADYVGDSLGLAQKASEPTSSYLLAYILWPKQRKCLIRKFR